MDTITLKTDLLRRKTEYLQALEELEKDIQTIETIEKKYSLNGKSVKPEAITDEVPASEVSAYPRDGSWPEKFLYIVWELERATFEEVSKRLEEHQPELGAEKAKRNSQLYLSSLYKNGKLKGKRIDGLYVYSL